jgi:hypothetical protein
MLPLSWDGSFEMIERQLLLKTGEIGKGVISKLLIPSK